ncbi:hypothetical protein [Futiania mangrovi]|uniref:Sulfatase-modifying factor enzyme domain-containing protein n=1 Tax=Futiania mangrovi TaxID=2959716 RepID=A0A9J6P7Y0_9PROT|nr:hypothetical protein [Futiania mangrovii]MCP1335436.1 hypothetical protein [Futiania mangrovii]
MTLTKLISVVASCVLILSGCGGGGTPQPKTPAEPTVFLNNGPFEQGTVSIFQPYVEGHSGFARLALEKSPLRNAADSYRWTQSGKTEYATQLEVVRSGDAFAWRLFLYGPGVIEAQAAPDGEGYLYVWHMLWRPESTITATEILGAVEFKRMQAVETPIGRALVSDWTWSPVAYAMRKSTHPTDLASMDQGWRSAVQSMSKERPIYTPGKTRILIGWADVDWIAEHHDRQVFGDEALAAITEAETQFAVRAPEAGGRAKIIMWLKENFNPVAPYTSLERACGPLPAGWREDGIAPSILSGDYSLGGARNRARALDTYAVCVEKFKEAYDVGPYAAIYPQVLEKIKEWQSLGGELVTDENVPSAGFIRSYASPAPEDVEYAFDQRIAMASDPRAKVRTELAEVERSAAAYRFREARKRQERNEAERRRRIALQQAYIANAMTLNQMRAENARLERQTQRMIASSLNEGRTNNRSGAGSGQRSAAIGSTGGSPASGASGTGASSTSSNRSQQNAPGATQQAATTPEAPRNDVLFLSTGTMEKGGFDWNIRKCPPSLFTGVGIQEVAQQRCQIVNEIKLFRLGQRARICREHDDPELKFPEAYGPQTYTHIVRISNLTSEESSKLLSRYGGANRYAQMAVSKSSASLATGAETAIINEYNARHMRAAGEPHLFRGLPDMQTFVQSKGCRGVQFVDGFMNNGRTGL